MYCYYLCEMYNNAPLVSIIVPNYNHVNYLQERLDSIVNQVYTNWELILLDDCSTDSSVIILDSFSAPKHVVTKLFNKKNSGSTFKQWQSGLDLAQGTLIWIAESDDVSDPLFLEKCVRELSQNLEIGLVFSSSSWMDSHSKVFHEPPHEQDSEIFSTPELRRQFLKGPLIYNASSAVFRKNLLDNVNFEQITTFKYAGDWLFWTQLLQQCKVKRLGERLNYFRRHSGNVSSGSDASGLNFIEGFKVVETILNREKSFFTRQKTQLYWAYRLAKSNLPNASTIIKAYPIIARFYYYIFRLFQ
jgi:glycosyltransferase involved in cell wall biosynthesis